MTYLIAKVVVQFCNAGLEETTSLWRELMFASEGALEDWIKTNIIPGIEGRTQSYCGPFSSLSTESLNAAIQLSYQAAAQVLLYMRTNKRGAIVSNPQGLDLQIPLIQAFTPDIIEGLKRLRPKATSPPLIVGTDYQTDEIAARWE